MFLRKIKSVLAMMLVVGLAFGGIALGVSLSTNPMAVAQEKTPRDAPVTTDRLHSPVTTKNAKTEQKELTPEEAIKQMPKENVTVEFKVVAVQVEPNHDYLAFGSPDNYIFLKDGGKFTARLGHAADQIMKLGIDPVKHFNGKVVRVTGRVEPESGNRSFQMWVLDQTHIEVVKE